VFDLTSDVFAFQDVPWTIFRFYQLMVHTAGVFRSTSQMVSHVNVSPVIFGSAATTNSDCNSDVADPVPELDARVVTHFQEGFSLVSPWLCRKPFDFNSKCQSPTPLLAQTFRSGNCPGLDGGRKGMREENQSPVILIDPG
jgi:hypothetical protein